MVKFAWFSAAILFASVIGDTVGGVLSLRTDPTVEMEAQ